MGFEIAKNADKYCEMEGPGIAGSHIKQYFDFLQGFRYGEIVMEKDERRSNKDRRVRPDRRKFNDPNYKGPERRSGKDRRSGRDRRDSSQLDFCHFYVTYC